MLLGFPWLCDYLPGQRLPSVHRHGGPITRWYYPGRIFQLNDPRGWLNAIDALRIIGYKCLQPVQGMVLLE